MLSPEQKAHFDTFGFLILRQAFSPDEIEKITCEAENIWEEHRKISLSKDEGSTLDEFVEQRPLLKNPLVDGGITLDQFIEQRPQLMNLLDDDRIHETIEDCWALVLSGQDLKVKSLFIVSMVGILTDREMKRKFHISELKS